MAVSSSGGFSIREYTAEIRKEDANKCWPFGGDVRESLLPPIECRRYRWWSSELQIARSAKGTEQEPDAVSCDPSAGVDGGEEDCGGEPTGSGGDGAVVIPAGALVLPCEISTAEDDEEGRIRSMEKPKARTPKKRSILELFALAPLVDAHRDEDQGKALITEVSSPKDDDEDEESDWCRLETQKKRRKESTKTRMRNRTKGNFVKKTNAREEKTAKKRENKKRRFQTKHQKRKNNFADGLSKEEKIVMPSKLSPADVPLVPSDSTITDISGRTKNTDLVIQQQDKAEKENRAPKTNYSKSCLIPEDINNCQRDASVHLVKAQTTDIVEKVGLKGEKKRTGKGEELILNSPGSTHMQSLCRVFSDVLMAASVVHSSSESNHQAMTEKPICGRPSFLSQKSVDVHPVTNPKGGCHRERNTGAVDMVDLNNPAEICTSPVRGLNEFSKGRTEPYDNVGDQNRAQSVLTGRSEGPSITSVVTPPLPLSGNLNFGLGSSSVVMRKRKANRQDSHNEDTDPCSPMDGMTSSVYNNWLTRELPQSDTIPPAMYFERSINRDIITGLPLDSQGELTNMKLRKQERPEYLLSTRNQANSPPVNRLQVHNFIEMVSLDLQNQQTSNSEVRQGPERNYGQIVGYMNASKIPSTASFCIHNELGLQVQPQLPTMRLMGTNVTLGKGNKEQGGSSEVKSSVDQRSISFSDPNLRSPESFLQQRLVPKRVAHVASHHPSHEIQDYPSTSKPYYLDVDRRSDDPLFRQGGSTNIFGNCHLPVHLTQPHVQKALLRNRVIDMGVQAPANVHQNFVLNSGVWKYEERLKDYWNHLQFPSDPSFSENLTHLLVKDGNPRASDVNFSGFPESSFSVRSPHALNFQPAPKLTSLASNPSNKTRENSSTFGSDGLVIPGKVGEQLPIGAKIVAHKSFDANHVANDDSSRSRPVKLCAGAKHILKPSLKMVDQDKPLAVHSTVPFVWEKGSSKVPVLHEKARIYQF